MYCFSSLEEFSLLREAIKGELVKISNKDAARVFIAINEGVNNAIFHGNKEDSSKNVHLTIEKVSNDIRIVIRDEGKGFLIQRAPGVKDCLAEGGRGLAIIEHCVDRYQLNSLGNEIILTKEISMA